MAVEENTFTTSGHTHKPHPRNEMDIHEQSTETIHGKVRSCMNPIITWDSFTYVQTVYTRPLPSFGKSLGTRLVTVYMYCTLNLYFMLQYTCTLYIPVVHVALGFGGCKTAFTIDLLRLVRHLDGGRSLGPHWLLHRRCVLFVVTTTV